MILFSLAALYLAQAGHAADYAPAQMLVAKSEKKMSVSDWRSIAFDNLTAFAETSCMQYVSEIRCRTNREIGIREKVQVQARRIIIPHKLNDYMARTFEKRIKSISLNPYEEPCDLSSLDEYRRLTSSFENKYEHALKMANIE